MRSIDLNLATRPARNNTLPWVVFVGSVILLVALGVTNYRSWVRHQELLVDLKTTLGGMDAQRDRLEARDLAARREVEKFDLGFLRVQAEKANEVIRRKAFSWTRLFNELQDVQPWDVQMTSVTPVFTAKRRSGPARQVREDPERVPVSVDGVAKTLEDFFEFQNALVLDDHFDRVEPERSDVDETTGEILFRMSFLYDPRVGEEQPEEAVQ